MSDYIPDPRQKPDPLNYRAEYTYEPVSGRSSFALLGILAALALIGGLLFFGSGQRPNDQQAMEPPAVTQTPATPGTPANPAPATPAAPRQ
jgi:hypothetical protein